MWLAIFLVAGLAVAFAIGADREAEPGFSGRYDVQRSNGCLGRSFDVRQSGQFVRVISPGGATGSLRGENGRIEGTLECVDSTTARASWLARSGSIKGRIDGRMLTASRVADEPPPEAQSTSRPAGIEGIYELTPPSACLGSEVELGGPSDDLALSGAGRIDGNATYVNGRLEGRAHCVDGSPAAVVGDAADRTIQLEVTPRGRNSMPERVEATETRDLNSIIGTFLLALLAIMVVARGFGQIAVSFRQPRVMGEVVAGIVLGPTVLGALAPEISATLFPADVIVPLGVVANLGVILYMFMIGAEVDLGQLRGRVRNVVAVSNGSLAIPVVLGVAVAIPTYEVVGPDVGFTEFALFMAVAMSITAFPVLARILAERGMLNRPIGATALGAAAINDVLAWFLIALATAIATSASGQGVPVTIALAIVYCLAMFFLVRPALARIVRMRPESDGVAAGALAGVLGAVLLSAYVTEAIGIAVIFGAFLMGLVMPRGAKLTEESTKRIEDFVLLLLLPVFFAYTGLRTNVSLLDDPDLWLLAGGLLLVAIAGKFGGAMLGARVSGLGWRDSAVLGTLMNTRGLTELIALNLALDLGVISEALFTALVLMALITTFMAGPLLNLLDRREHESVPATLRSEPV